MRNLLDIIAAKVTVFLFEAMNRYDDALMAAYAELNKEDDE